VQPNAIEPPTFGMARFASFVAVAAVLTLSFAAAPDAGQQQATPLSFRPADWGLADPADIRYGQVAEILNPSGPRLVMYDLSKDWTAPPAVTPETGTVPPYRDGRLVVATFDSGNRNTLGGVFNAFSRRPAEGRAAIAAAPDGVGGLNIECSGVATGFCGAWVQLFDARSRPQARRFLDARPFSALTFRVWSERPDDDVVIKVADAAWEAREDAPTIGPLHQFTSTGRLGPEWREVRVPLSRLAGTVDRKTLASLILESRSATPVNLFVRDLTFVADGVRLPPMPAAPSTVPAPRRLDRAVWVWHSDALLGDAEETRRTVEFLRRQSVTTAFLQLPTGPEKQRAPGEQTVDARRLGPLVAAFSAAGIRVYALDGAPEFAAARYHDGVVRTVQHVAAYNAVVAPAERFVGVRFDIEPYLLPGFHGPRQESILRDFMALVERIVAQARPAGLRVGLDIPFWYDAPAERTFRDVALEWNGRRQSASDHLIDLVDDVSIMAYRTVAYGADGTINHAEGEVRRAAAKGKAVYIGLETTPLPDERLLEFWGEPTSGIPERPATVDRLVLASTADDVAVILVPAGADPRAYIQFAVDGSRRRVLWWPVRRVVPVPAGKLTFAGLESARLERVMVETARELGSHASFAGFSIHDVRGWAALVDPSVNGRPAK
jgi:hypothetical protein